jgi:hypothetical protein
MLNGTAHQRSVPCRSTGRRARRTRQSARPAARSLCGYACREPRPGGKAGAAVRDRSPIRWLNARGGGPVTGPPPCPASGLAAASVSSYRLPGTGTMSSPGPPCSPSALTGHFGGSRRGRLGSCRHAQQGRTGHNQAAAPYITPVGVSRRRPTTVAGTRSISPYSNCTCECPPLGLERGSFKDSHRPRSAGTFAAACPQGPIPAADWGEELSRICSWPLVIWLGGLMDRGVR